MFNIAILVTSLPKYKLISIKLIQKYDLFTQNYR